jgi:cell division protein FtsQ
VIARRPARLASRYSVNRGFSSGMLSVLLLFTISIAGAVWVSVGIVTKERWPIRWLELNGSFARVSADQLRGSLVPLIRSSFFSVDLQALRQVASRNSWVAAVSVQKRWPDTVVVTIEEHVPVAHWNSGELISARGQRFKATEADEIQGLPWLQGPEEQVPAVLEYWTRFNSMLDSASLEIEQLTLDQRGAWSLQLNRGTALQLGRKDASERLQRLMNSWGTLMHERRLPPVLVDLRYTNGFAVRWPEGSADFAGTDRK